MVAYGGIDALIWLCRSSKNKDLHHLTTTILAMLAEKESIRPVIITKWALSPLLFLIRHYTNTQQKTNNKKSPTNSIHSTENNSEADLSSDAQYMSVVLEIMINCTHILYQLSRAGILSQKEVISDGVFSTLLMLATFNITNMPTDEQQQVMSRVDIIQSLASKAISSISSLVSLQVNIIEEIQGTNKLSDLLRSSSDEVRKYAAKTIAYLSLRNDKYKPVLLCGDGSKALISILAILPQKDMDEECRSKDLEYYLPQGSTGHLEKDTEQQSIINSATVSHVCCALANFATNNESQVNLMSQPHLLRYICNVFTTFPNHTEILRHVARCIANLALYDCFNVLPTLLSMGKVSKSDVQRHIVRAIDNLSSNVPLTSGDDNTPSHWRELFGDAYLYISKILEDEDGDVKDVDTIKRAKSIIAREKQEPDEEEIEEVEEEEEESGHVSDKKNQKHTKNKRRSKKHK
ncbi:MAG: armadillo-type protein [Benjaminiella poitrasii]|nr:MAG: armadillo-type protein [Benjaminiella poitrasii]